MHKIRLNLRDQRRCQNYSRKCRLQTSSTPDFLMRHMNGKNQYICHFCQKPCAKTNKRDVCKDFGKKARWNYCWDCNVAYAVSPGIRLQAIKLWQHDPKEPKNFYQMLIDYKHQKTSLSYYPKYIYPSDYVYPNHPFKG